MGKIIELRENDFGVNNGYLTIRHPGLLFAFFKMDRCGGCEAFGPEFIKFARSFSGNVDFGICNLSNARNVIKMSKNTRTPITKVPKLIMFNDGITLANYKAKEKDPRRLMAFIERCIQNIQSSQTFGSGGAAYTHAPRAPQQQQRPSHMPAHQPAGRPAPHAPSTSHYTPNIPAQHINASNAGHQRYAQLGYSGDEDVKLLIPQNVTPHNVPWQKNANLESY